MGSDETAPPQAWQRQPTHADFNAPAKSFLSWGRQESSGLRPAPVFCLQDPEGQAGASVHMIIKSWLKNTCQTRKANLFIPSRTLEQGTRLLRPRAVALRCPSSSLRASLDCLPNEESAPRYYHHLGSPSPLLMEESLALALPQQQVAFAAWHLFLEGGCQEGANPRITRLVCPPESLHEGGVCAAWRGSSEPALVESVRVRRRPRLVLSSQSLPLPLQVSCRRAEVWVLGAGWG